MDIMIVPLDVDECAASVSPCSDNATCINSAGSFHCRCNIGYVGDGFNCYSKECLCIGSLEHTVHCGIIYRY